MNVNVGSLSFSQPYKISEKTYQVFITHKEIKGIYAVLLIETGEFKYYRHYDKEENEDKALKVYENYIGSKLGMFTAKSNLKATLNYKIETKDEHGNIVEKQKSVIKEI